MSNMRNTLITLLALGLLVTACTVNADDGPVAAAGPAASCDPEIGQALEAWETAGFSGSVAFLGGERTCVAAYGAADPETGAATTTDTTFSLGSITKAVTAAAITQLSEDGVLSYEDRAGDLVPGLSGPAAAATIEQLLVHTGGMTGNHGRDHEALDRSAAITNISGLVQVAGPGEEFLYSNAGYSTLALVVDELTDGYRQYLRQQILVDGDGGPIGGFWDGEPAAPGPRAIGTVESGERGVDGSFQGPHWALDGNGGVAMTAAELADWTIRLFGGELLGDAATERLTTTSFDHGDGTAEIPGWVSIDSAPYGEPMYGTSGGGGGVGHEMTVAYLPESGRVFVIASNSPEVRAETLLQQLIEPLVSGDAPVGPSVGVGLDEADRQQLVGTWAFGDGAKFEISQDGEAIQVSAADSAAISRLFPVPSAADAAAHEELTLDVVGGSTEEGRNERRLLEEEFGPIKSIQVMGTWFAEFEYRTYLLVSFDADSVVLWLALDDAGGIAGAALEADPPSLRYLPQLDVSFAPLDPVSTDLGLRITLRDMTLEITNGGNTETASRVSS